MAMNAIRAFIAIDFSEDIQEKLDFLVSQLKTRLVDVPVRWIPARNIHLTLKFLGEVSTANLDILYSIIQNESERLSGFEMSIGNLGAFPSTHRPRVIWVGIESQPELFTLQRGVEIETSRLGYARDKRPFSPHLTIGRVSRNARTSHFQQLDHILSNCKVGFIGATRVQSVHLYQSDLRREGPIYTRLYSANLGIKN